MLARETHPTLNPQVSYGWLDATVIRIFMAVVGVLIVLFGFLHLALKTSALFAFVVCAVIGVVAAVYLLYFVNRRPPGFAKDKFEDARMTFRGEPAWASRRTVLPNPYREL